MRWIWLGLIVGIFAGTLAACEIFMPWNMRVQNALWSYALAIMFLGLACALVAFKLVMHIVVNRVIEWLDARRIRHEEGK